MNTTEIAIENGVALPETCQKFCKYFEFNHFKHIWILKDGKWSVELTKHHAKFLPIEKVMPAPQMHEIAPLLPREIKIDCFDFYLKICPNGKKGSINYELQENQDYEWEDNEWELVEVFVNGFDYENGNIAQSCAELYLQLKEKGLI